MCRAEINTLTEYKRLFDLLQLVGVLFGAVGCGTALQAGRSQVRFPMG